MGLSPCLTSCKVHGSPPASTPTGSARYLGLCFSCVDSQCSTLEGFATILLCQAFTQGRSSPFSSFLAMSAVSLAGFCWSTRDNIEGAYVASEVSHWLSQLSVGLLSPLRVIPALPAAPGPPRGAPALSHWPPPLPFLPLVPGPFSCRAV